MEGVGVPYQQAGSFVACAWRRQAVYRLGGWIVYALDLSSGKERWSFKTGGQITSSPAYENNAVYFGGIDTNVYSVDAKSGRLRWSFKTGGPVPSSPALHDGVLYIGSMDHCVYALKA